MTGPEISPADEEDLNLWLATQRSRLIEHLGAVLDREAGLREVAIHERHDDLVRSLENALEIETGLSKIIHPGGSLSRPEGASAQGPRGRLSGGSAVRGVLLPAYVMVDESGSMAPYRAELSLGLTSLIEALRSEPIIAAKLRLAVLGFSEDVQVRLAIADMRTETTVPQVAIRGVTNYGAVFNDLLYRIPADVQWLRGQGYKVHRPVVFFLSDGQPTDGNGWRTAYAALVDKSQTLAAPNIIACGIGDATAATMVDVATSEQFAFVAKPEVNIGAAISEFFAALFSSLVESGQALNSENPTLVVNRPETFTMAIDEV